MKALPIALLLLFAVRFAVAQETITVVGTITLEGGQKGSKKMIIPKARVMFRSGAKEYWVGSDEKGKYSIVLPPGTYSVYADGTTPGTTCFVGICPEFIKKDPLIIGKKKMVKLDITLEFHGEG